MVAQPCRSRSSRLVVQAYQKLQKRLKYSKSGSKRSEPLVVTVEPDGSDAWRLDQIVDMLKDGAVGVIPTDTLPAIVADVHNRDAVLRLYTIKEMDAKKPLSLLCNSFTCISTYTTGFPNSNTPGQPNWFNMARRILPGPVSPTTALLVDMRDLWSPAGCWLWSPAGCWLPYGVPVPSWRPEQNPHRKPNALDAATYMLTAPCSFAFSLHPRSTHSCCQPPRTCPLSALTSCRGRLSTARALACGSAPTPCARCAAWGQFHVCG